MIKYIPVAIFCSLLWCDCCLARSEMIINNRDSAGEGLNDSTPTDPVGGNTGTTLGEQRQIALQYAADLIGLTINSEIPITINADFQALGGSSTGGTLASAGPVGVLESFENAPMNNVWYPASLANKLAGKDFSTASEVDAVFNSDVDGSQMLGSNHWYYGLDANPPSGDVDFVTVTLHELLHGFGFLALFEIDSGQKFQGLNDIYAVYLNRLSTSPSALNEMTNLQRSTAVKSTGDLYWQGSAANDMTDLPVHGISGANIAIYAPNPIEYGSSTSHFDTSLFPNNLMEPSYDGANHDLGVAAALLSDIGWGVLSDLSLVLQTPSAELEIETSFPYSLVAANEGRNVSTNTFVRYSPPSNAIIQSVTTDQGSCEETTDDDQQPLILCNLGDLAVSAIATIDLSMRFSSTGTINHAAQIYGTIVEEQTHNNLVASSESVVAAVSDSSGSTDSDSSSSDLAQSTTEASSSSDSSSTSTNSAGSSINTTSSSSNNVTGIGNNLQSATNSSASGGAISSYFLSFIAIIAWLRRKVHVKFL